MSKDKISDYSSTANSNTDIAGINIDEGCAPSGINNAIRTLMKQLKDFQQGTNSDSFNGPTNGAHNGTVGATTPAAGTFTSITSSGDITINNGNADGGQLLLASSGYSNWGLDNYSGRLRAYYGSTEYATIDASGNVGIGTSSPSYKLHIANSSATSTTLLANILARIQSNASGADASLQFSDNVANSAGISLNQGNMTFSIAGSSAAQIDTSANFKFNSGYGSVATAYGCRAWVNFNGTGTVAIRASGNVSSITDNGTGDYTVNFTTAMPDDNYGMTMVGQRRDGSGVYNGTNGIYAGAAYTPTASAIRVTTSGTTGTNGIDYIAASVNIFR